MQKNNPSTYIRILTIAGSDSGGGAGIQADLKTIAALGCYGMSAITAITAQNTLGVTGIEAVSPKMLAAQIDAVVSDIGVDAVKIGMLHDPEVVHVVADAIRKYQLSHNLSRIVLDPVMVASSGDALIAPPTVAVLVKELFPLVTVITPNLDEAALLLGRPINSRAELDAAAHDLVQLGAKAALLKGGHLAGDDVTDVLLANGKLHSFSSPRIASHNTHGTGCTLSSAMACYLGMGLPLDAAVAKARSYILQAIAAGSQVTIGAGHGPLNHGFAPIAMQII
ncbi:MAG: bifunctional hydroxymethylpyrimidine kinase/phosphomethylpyrimidine kinase [Cytophagales bacterium]|nr:bifunctional hydroxymethylpyrimidine kinase/phosphomethylpyrimidine kinase [Cytophagales bacterium]